MAKKKKGGHPARVNDLTKGAHTGRSAVKQNTTNAMLTRARLSTKIMPTPNGVEPHWPYGK